MYDDLNKEFDPPVAYTDLPADVRAKVRTVARSAECGSCRAAQNPPKAVYAKLGLHRYEDAAP